jgi:FAD:protein FMN transferase
MTANVAFPVFGTTGVLIVTEPAALAKARAIADVQLAAVDLACSRFRPDSELSRLNKAHGELTHVSELFATLIAEALRAPAWLTEAGLPARLVRHDGSVATAAGWPAVR